MQDITPYKAAGAALREAEARYRTLVEQIPAVVYVDPAGALGSPLYVSPRVEMLLGYTSDEWLAGANLWIQLLHPDDRERILAETARANLERHATRNVEVVVGDGTIGLPDHAPYDAIVVSAAFPRVPDPLADQVVPGGRLVHPLGSGGHEEVALFERGPRGLVRRATLTGARFVRLVGEHGFGA